MLAIPMALDLVATILLSVGLLVTTASVSQMLRGSGMLFAALFALTFLKRRLNRRVLSYRLSTERGRTTLRTIAAGTAYGFPGRPAVCMAHNGSSRISLPPDRP